MYVYFQMLQMWKVETNLKKKQKQKKTNVVFVDIINYFVNLSNQNKVLFRNRCSILLSAV